MGKQLDVDKARRILPSNAVPGVAELNSNFTLYVAELNPETAGEKIEPVDCGSTADVAEQFKPQVALQVKKINNIGADEVSEETVDISMKYGNDPKEIMNDFKSENVVVKAKDGDNERTLLNQQLDFLALDELVEKLKDKKFQKLVASNKDGLLKSIEEEIQRIDQLIKDAEFDSMFE